LRVAPFFQRQPGKATDDSGAARPYLPQMPTAHLDDRAVLRIAGAEAREFLQGLLTNDVTGPLPVYAGLLSAQGKTMFDMIVHEGDDAVLLDVAAAQVEALARRLSMYKLRRAVTIDPSDCKVFARWDQPGDKTADPRSTRLGERWLADNAATDATTADYTQHRMKLGVPDTVEMSDLLWLETNADELHGVSFTKGCYVGQENTARMHHRDKLRRRLMPVRIGGGDGAIMAGEREAGDIRAASGDLGIAYLRMEYAEAALSRGNEPVEVIWPEWLPR
jgi:folate-binding protein YgfZ